jgi:hypothetical protein
MQLKPLLFVFLLLVTGAARAADPVAVYTVSGIAVDVRAPSLADARDQAFLDGQRQGFRTLMERLTPPAQHASLPEVSGGEVARMVESVAVDSEKAGGNRYLAQLTVRYHPQGVQQFLTARGIVWNDAQRPRTVIVPLYRADGATVLWQEPNPWKQAWDALRSEPPLTPLAVPAGDLADVQALTLAQAEAPDAAALLRLASRYHATLADVVIAEPVAGAAHPTVTITRISLTDTGIVRADPLTVEAQEGDLLAKAVQETLAALASDWRAGTGAAAAQPEATLRLWMPVTGLQDWLYRRDTLRNVPNVRGVDVLALAPSRVDVNLRYAGTEQELNAALRAAGLQLEMDTPSGWILRPLTPGMAPVPEAPATAPATTIVPPGPVMQPGRPTMPDAIPANPSPNSAWERTPVQEIGPLEESAPQPIAPAVPAPTAPYPPGGFE